MTLLATYFVHTLFIRNMSCLVLGLLSGIALFGRCPARFGALGCEGNPTLSPTVSFDHHLEGTEGRQPTEPGSDTITFQQLSHKVPNKARHELEKAEQARSTNRAEEAISHFNKAVAIDPEYVAARNNLGSLYLILNRADEGIAQLEEAAKIDPHEPAVFANLAVGYAMLSKFEDSERAARTLISLDRTGVRGPTLLGFALVKQRKFTDEALHYLDRAKAQYPPAYLLAAKVFQEKADLERAQLELRTYLTTGEQRFREFAESWLRLLSKGEQETAALLPR